MNKKAVSARDTVILIVLGLALTVFTLLLIKAGISEASTEVITREKCGTTVDRMDRFNLFSIPIPDRSLNCPTINLTIDDKDDDENNKIMANALYNCAKQFRRGEARLFTNDGVHCNVCYIFDIQTDEPVEGFYRYLFENTVPEASGQTYYEYLQGFKSEGAEKLLGEIDNPVLADDLDLGEAREITLAEELKIDSEDLYLQPGNQHAAIFIYARGQDNFDKIFRHLTAQTPAGVAGLALGGISFFSYTSGGAAAGLGAAAIFTGPVGWAVFGTGVAVGVIHFAIAEAFTYHFSPDTPPEYATFFVFRNWDRDNARDLLVDDIGCDYFS